MELTVQREQAEEQLRRQCEELRARGQKELQQVQEELAVLQQDLNQSVLQAESAKQQVCEVVPSASGPRLSSRCPRDPDPFVCCGQALSQKEAEKVALMEQLAAQKQDLATAGMERERIQREALSKQEQDKVPQGTVILALVSFLALYI